MDPKSIKWFDAFGVVPPLSVQELVKRSGKKLQYNKEQLQAEKSESCGWWCVRAANALLQGISIPKFVKRYSATSQTENEQKLHSEFHGNSS